MSAPLAVARLAPPGFKLNPVPTPTRRRGRVVVASASPSANDAELAAKDENPYEILGVDVTASKRAVRDAFRAAAKRAHPDTPGGSAKAFDALAKLVQPAHAASPAPAPEAAVAAAAAAAGGGPIPGQVGLELLQQRAGPRTPRGARGSRSHRHSRPARPRAARRRRAR